jgi:hypothetical protein
MTATLHYMTATLRVKLYIGQGTSWVGRSMHQASDFLILKCGIGANRHSANRGEQWTLSDH